MIEKYQGLIHKTVRTVVGTSIDRADIEDIVQDVNVHLMSKALSAYDPSRSELATFIHTVTRNMTIDYLRGRNKLQSWLGRDTPSCIESEDGECNPNPVENIALDELDALGMLIKNEQEQRLAKAIEGLDPEDRMFLRVVLSDTFDAESYAAKRGVKAVAIRVRKSRIADKLRVLIKRESEA